MPGNSLDVQNIRITCLYRVIFLIKELQIAEYKKHNCNYAKNYHRYNFQWLTSRENQHNLNYVNVRV